ncbi:MAG: response regulator transcription factor [Peptococcaceae bacterium]|nr:response regulator transcription factor [Peptococcaceae bacterium]
MILQGYSYSQIAEQLFVTPNTVKYHVRNILRKTGVNNRYELCIILRE